MDYQRSLLKLCLNHHINIGLLRVLDFGHNKIKITKELENYLKSTFEMLITQENVKYFYFGGFGDFDDFAHKVTTKLKEKYPFIKRVYICEDYKFISRPHKRTKWLKDEDYEEITYLDLNFDYWYSRIYYRNCEIIDHSDYCVFCVDETVEYSGAKKALEYAKRKKKEIINVLQTV